MSLSCIYRQFIMWKDFAMHVTYSEGNAFLNHVIACRLIIEAQNRLQSLVKLSLTYFRLVKGKLHEEIWWTNIKWESTECFYKPCLYDSISVRNWCIIDSQRNLML